MIAVIVGLLLVHCQVEPEYDARALSIFVYGGSVYTAGRGEDADGVPTACYWKGTSRTDMSERGSAAYSVFVDGGTVYTAGEFWSEHYNVWGPCIWAGPTLTKLSAMFGSYGYATSVFVSGGSTYAAGQLLFEAWHPFYWTDEVWTELPTAGFDKNAYVYDIFVEGGTVYTAGRYYNGVGWIACYWENDTRTDLPGGSGAAYSIYVDSGTVYTAGEYFTGNEWHGCYWVNTSRVSLSGWSSRDYANSIFVYNGRVYVAGAYYQDYYGVWQPFYQMDGESIVSLRPPDEVGWVNGYATDIFVSEGTVYTSGYYHNGSVNVPCYWKDTTITDLPSG